MPVVCDCLMVEGRAVFPCIGPQPDSIDTVLQEIHAQHAIALSCKPPVSQKFRHCRKLCALANLTHQSLVYVQDIRLVKALDCSPESQCRQKLLLGFPASSWA